MSLQHTATHCNTLQHVAPHCNTLQHTATRCTTLQHRSLMFGVSRGFAGPNYIRIYTYLSLFHKPLVYVSFHVYTSLLTYSAYLRAFLVPTPVNVSQDSPHSTSIFLLAHYGFSEVQCIFFVFPHFFFVVVLHWHSSVCHGVRPTRCRYSPWLALRGGGLGSRPIFKKFNEPYAPS